MIGLRNGLDVRLSKSVVSDGVIYPGLDLNNFYVYTSDVSNTETDIWLDFDQMNIDLDNPPDISDFTINYIRDSVTYEATITALNTEDGSDYDEPVYYYKSIILTIDVEYMSTTSGASSQTELTIPDAAAVYLNTKIVITSVDASGTYSNLINTPGATMLDAGVDASSFVLPAGATVVLWGIKTGASTYRWAIQQ